MQKIFYLKRSDCFLSGNNVGETSEEAKKRWLKENYEEGEIHYYLKRGWSVVEIKQCHEGVEPGAFVVIEKK